MLTHKTCEQAVNSATTGWLVLVAAVGMMLGLLSVDITHLTRWNEATTPVFVGTAIGRVAAVIAAFVGGKLIPAGQSGPDRRRRTRATSG